MPMIEIETDSTEVIERARRQIARIASTKYATGAQQQAEHLRVVGWLSALLSEELISETTYVQLTGEAKAEAAAVHGT